MNKASDDESNGAMTVAERIRFQLLNDLPFDDEVTRYAKTTDVTTFARHGTY
ncbi:MAG: hypothetical protein HKL86_08105 [Acidimicrobiaceae bacterium]|nr:hypothetical protein [Acidimicrobiaceae bacterium]